MNIFIGMETSGELRRRFAAKGHHVISCDLLSAQDGADEFILGGGISHPDDMPKQTHIVGDVFDALNFLGVNNCWPDMAIFHPTCTYLTISAAWAFKDPDFAKYPGVGYHQKVKPGTLTGAARRAARAARAEQIEHVDRIWKLPIKKKIIENPKGFLSTMWRKHSQVIQPYEYGDDASKGTCLWLDNLPPLKETGYFKPRMWCKECHECSGYDAAFMHGCQHCGAECGKLLPRWSNQTDTGQNNLSPDDDRWKVRSNTYPGIADAIVEQYA